MGVLTCSGTPASVSAIRGCGESAIVELLGTNAARAARVVKVEALVINRGYQTNYLL